MLSWLKKISGIELNTEVAITSSRYDFTDLLLPHDDQLEGRKFAFIVYLSPDWKAEQGGQLLLYNCDGEFLFKFCYTLAFCEYKCISLYGAVDFTFPNDIFIS